MAYAAAAEPLKVPRTPLESRQGYHPKGEDQLVWRSPPTRQLSRDKRVEYESDIRERFYDDYLGARTTGDAKNEVLAGLSKLKFDPQLYRANAYQGLVYDPMRPVPRGVDLKGALRAEKERERQRHTQEHRQRRMSDSFLTAQPGYPSQSGQPLLEALEPRHLTGPSTQQSTYTNERPRSALQKSMDVALNPDVVPAVEDWMSSADNKDKEVAMKFFRTLSSHGKRPDPASKAALHRTRVRSAVMTPSRKQRQDEQMAQSNYQQLSRDMAAMEAHYGGKKRSSDPTRRRRTSSTERVVTKGSMFTANKGQQPSHFTVHPEWSSEVKDHSHSRKRKY